MFVGCGVLDGEEGQVMGGNEVVDKEGGGIRQSPAM